jgi:uncharacterized protein GlcG (DUF336 family)
MNCKRATRIAGILACLVAGSGAGQAQDSEFVTHRTMSPELAFDLARESLKVCRAEGYQVAVAVVDRFGVVQVVLRDRFAGAHTPETARRKAWTSVSFRTSTSELEGLTQPGQPQSGARQITDALMIGGGLIIESGGAIVGGIGISGAPGGTLDENCAKAAMEALADRLEPL